MMNMEELEERVTNHPMANDMYSLLAEGEISREEFERTFFNEFGVPYVQYKAHMDAKRAAIIKKVLASPPSNPMDVPF